MPASTLPPHRSWGPTALLAALLLPLLLLTGLPAPAQGTTAATGQTRARPVHAQPVAPEPDSAESLLVELQWVQPAVAEPGAPLRLRGTLTNRGTRPLTLGSVRVSTAYTALDTAEAIAGWATERTGTAPHVVATGRLSRTLPAGARTTFLVAAPPGAVDPPFDLATLPLLVEVTADDATDPTVLGTARSFLPWWAGDEAEVPLGISLLAPLTLPADPALSDPDDDVRRAAWRRAVGPRSAPVRLLEALSGTEATVVVDPALLAPLDPVSPLAEPEPAAPEPGEGPAEEETGDQPTGEDPTATESPGATASPTGEVPAGEEAAPDDDATTTTGPAPTAPQQPAEPEEPGDPAPAPSTADDPARRLRSLLAEVDDERLWWLPTADPDLTALAGLGNPAGVMERLLAVDPTVGDPGRVVTEDLARLLGRGRDDLAWPVAQGLDDAALTTVTDAYAAAHPSGAPAAVVLPSSAVADASGQTRALTRHGSGTVLLTYDDTASAPVATLEPGTPPGLAVQRMLAETLAAYQEQPATTRHLVLALPRGGALDGTAAQALAGALQQASWLQDEPAQDALGRPGTAGAGTATLTPPTVAGDVPAADGPSAYPPAGGSPLTETRLRRVEELRARVRDLATMLPDGEDRARSWDPALDTLYSARWRQDPPGWGTLPDAVDDLADEVAAGLHVNPSTVNFLADEGLIRLTVVNALPVEVRDLTVSVRPRNGRLRVVQAPDPVTIGPSSRATVQFVARAVGSGPVPVETTLRTPGGTPLGEPEEHLVRVTPTGVWIYWVLGIGAGAILVVGLVRAWRPRPARPHPDPESP